ncbi:MAG: ribokinase [Acidimicrobiales bacterium]
MSDPRPAAVPADVSASAVPRGRVVVIGSLNVDHTVWVERLPAAGETLLARVHDVTLGGKGLNQAVTAARQGADVAMVGCVGEDLDGAQVIATLEHEGIDASLVRRHAELPTGRAHITVADDGANTIVVVPGANLSVDFPSAALTGAQVLLAQLESPLDVVVAALSAARAAGVVTVLNPSPAIPLPAEVLDLVDYLVPNEHEARALDVEHDYPASGTLIVTHGDAGASVRKGGREKWLPAVEVERVVDPTAAGDAFCGTLAAGLARGVPFGVVLSRSAAAGAHAVTIAGALPSLPTADDVDAVMTG